MAMSDSEHQDGVAALAGEAVAPIQEELRQRLVVEVGDRDALAIETALLKAFINGMRAGGAEAAETMIEQTVARTALASAGQIPTPAQLDQPLPSLDPWAAKYGGEA
ncbi:MAG: hypothetical protein ABSG93_14625 [Solirubrobacteraceae bacterium]|jgi:hypothetical protein